jgi:hypothetical protein
MQRELTSDLRDLPDLAHKEKGKFYSPRIAVTCLPLPFSGSICSPNPWNQSAVRKIHPAAARDARKSGFFPLTA